MFCFWNADLCVMSFTLVLLHRPAYVCRYARLYSGALKRRPPFRTDLVIRADDCELPQLPGARESVGSG